MLQSKLDVVTANDNPRLTTLDHVKGELDITTRESDDLLTRKIDEATSDILAALGFPVIDQTLQETFWHSPHRFGVAYAAYSRGDEELFLRGTPVSTIVSATLDDAVVDPTQYRLDGDTGQLYALDVSGYPCRWLFSKSLIIVYRGGWTLPGTSSPTLPAALEGAAIDLVKMFWHSRKVDPRVKSEELPGVRRVEYWVGAVGDPELLPPIVLARIASFRRPCYAVA